MFFAFSQLFSHFINCFCCWGRGGLFAFPWNTSLKFWFLIFNPTKFRILSELLGSVLAKEGLQNWEHLSTEVFLVVSINISPLKKCTLSCSHSSVWCVWSTGECWYFDMLHWVYWSCASGKNSSEEWAKRAPSGTV